MIVVFFRYPFVAAIVLMFVLDMLVCKDHKINLHNYLTSK